MQCPDDRKMYEFIDDELTPEERLAVMRHIKGCDGCMKRFKVLVGLERVLQKAWDKFRERECLSPEELHDYWQGTLTDSETARVKKHLEQCAVCSLILDESAWLAEEWELVEQEWLKTNEERVGKRTLEMVRAFLTKQFGPEKAEEILANADVYLLDLAGRQ